MNATFSSSSSYGNLNTGEDVSLPVTLSSFKCRNENQQIVLEWTTESEINNEGFIIERANFSDGPYIQIASYEDKDGLKGQGTASYATKYVFRDNNVKSNMVYYYQLISKDINGSLNIYGPVNNCVQEMQPNQYSLEQNYPNPFNASTLIKYTLPNTEKVVITIYDISGKKLEVLVDRMMDEGIHQVKFEADHFASGIYFYEIMAGKFRQLHKMILVK